jgi:hypothetical protein
MGQEGMRLWWVMGNLERIEKAGDKAENMSNVVGRMEEGRSERKGWEMVGRNNDDGDGL